MNKRTPEEDADILLKAWNKLITDLAEMFLITKFMNWIISLRKENK